mmetsp:Transcript_64179/g.187787  ORF Transcript_64179/g.187787 Transcript_64179/m.187787 type:complete len:211 (-) Transcript_64179:1331-1963(-)
MRLAGPGFGHVLPGLESHLGALELLQGSECAYGVLRVRGGGAHGADGHDEGVGAGEGVGEHAREEALPVGRLLALGRAHHAEALLEREDRGVDLGSVLAALRIVVGTVLSPLAARAVHERQHRRRWPTPSSTWTSPWWDGRRQVHPVDCVGPGGGVVHLRRAGGAVRLGILHTRHQVLCGGDLSELEAQDVRPVVLVFHDLQLLLRARLV